MPGPEPFGSSSSSSSPSPSSAQIIPFPNPFKPDLFDRAWCSAPHPTLPLIATSHAKAVTVFSLSTFSAHSSLTGGHERSVRSVAWKPSPPTDRHDNDNDDNIAKANSNNNRLCLATASFDSTAALWRWQGSSSSLDHKPSNNSSSNDDEKDDWEFTLVLDGHDSEIKSAVFSPSGVYLATCSRDKSVWIWEDVGASEADDDWETVAVLNEHDGDVKAVAWCPDVPGRVNPRKRRFGADALASASYDGTVRVWREDFDGDWVCVAVMEGHQGTVWGVQWEGRPRPGDRFPRLLSFSADGTIRIWTLDEPEDESGGGDGASSSGGAASALGGIPNTMRTSLRENWNCTAVLPTVHHKDIYSTCWSAKSGMVASVGSDGVLALYAEENDQWRVLARTEMAHGPYEINHVTWCPRHDAECKDKGVEEMLVTTGDDGMVRPWKVEVEVGAHKAQ